MSATSIQAPFPLFTDIDGQPLEAGEIFIGVAGLDPITNPINVYWDAALTQLATQPIPTRGGYPLNGTVIGRLYVGSDYSIKAASRAGNVVYSATSAGERISSDLVTFIQAGAGAQPRSVQSKLRDVVSVKDFGAVGDGIADDTAAIQAAVTHAQQSGLSVYIPSGTYKVTSTIASSGAPSIVGDGTKSVVFVSSNSITAFEFAVNTTSVDGWGLYDFSVIGPITSNATSIAFKFVGDNLSFLQYGGSNCFVYGFGAAVKDEKVARTTGFGKEAMLNWNKWSMTLINQGKAGFWATQGSGTGNSWSGQCIMNGAAVPVLLFEGSGCVVGDILASGHWGNQVAGGVGLEIGPSTVYRAQINTFGVQFDANCDVPIKLSSTGATEYTNLSVVANNWGGNAQLGQSLRPLRNSVVVDRDTSWWQSGKFVRVDTTGLQVIAVFEIDFAAWGAGNFTIYACGLVGGVGVGVAKAEYDIAESVGSLTVTSISNRLTGPASCAAISVASTGTKATVSITFTPASTNTSVNVTLVASGDKFKVTRV